jgi:type IV pilus assembly protein PilZ
MSPKSDKPKTDVLQERDAHAAQDAQLPTEASGAERREHQRFDTSIAVDYASGDTFLFAYLQNISEMGIFIRTDHPKPVGTRLRLRFQTNDGDPLDLDGEVTWINPLRASGDNLNPGMGVRFIELTPYKRERVVGLVRTVAYLHKDDSEAQA